MNENNIAIIGMAVRAPGARSLAEFWNNLLCGRESIETLSEEALLAAGEPRSRLQNSHYVPRAAMLPGMEMFDAEFFGMSPKEAAIMDPQHRQFLECAWEAFENAAKTPDTFDGPVGVFAGGGMGSYFYFNVCSNRHLIDQVGMFLLRHTGNDKDFLSTRVSYLFDLRGPSVNVQTACSTSLVAVHYACQSLLSGECDMALAGGVTIELPHRRGYIYQDGEILSPDGHCRAFDHRAAGTVFGSGVGTVVLRRLADAIRDGDPIHAVIKATAVNNDGASKAGYLAPSVSGQAAAIIEAQALAGIAADQVGYVECHGTGTYLGDPIEVEALTQAFRRSTTSRGFCRIGSVKTNIGHTDTAAGVIGLIKAAMAVKHGRIPATLNFEKPNPTINFAESPFVVNDRLYEWASQNGVRIAAVNSLGVGGTNAHAIIQSAPAAAPRATVQRDDKPALLVVTARNKAALEDAARRLADALEGDPSLDLGDAAFTLLTGRKHFEHRRLIPVSDRNDAIAICRDPASRRGSTRRAVEGKANAAFLFPGGGAQHVGMAQGLYRRNERFRAIVDEGLSYLSGAAADEIRSAWFAERPELARALQKPSVQLPAILIVEIALSRFWMEWGLKPSVLIGHSMGENAAACVAGVFSFRDAVNLVRIRGELFDEIAGGGMLSVALSEAELKTHLPDSIDIASVNAPQLCVVSGTKTDLNEFAQYLTGLGIDSQAVAIDIAAHSRMLEPILGRFEAFVRSIPLRTPTIPIVSNLTAELLTADQARDPAYWVRHLRSTVRFAEGVSRIAEPQRVFIEVGPGKTLSSLLKVHGAVDANQIVNSLPHAEEAVDDDIHLLGAWGAAWALGLPLDISRQWAGASPSRVALPSYPFRQQRYFLDPVVSSGDTLQDDTPQKLEEVADWGYEPAWTQSVPPVRAGAVPPRQRWLILLDDAGLGRALSLRLKQLGHDVVAAEVGDSFRRLDAERYVLCPEDGRESFDSLFQHLAEDGTIPDRIVDFWLYTSDEAHRPGSSFFHRNQERGFYALFHLARALSQADITQDIALTVITNGMQSVGGETIRHPGKSTVLGAVQVLPKEYGNLSIRAIDIPLAGDGSAFAPKGRRGFGLGELTRAISGGEPVMPAWFDLLWDDLTTATASEIVAYRNGRRWLRGFDRISLPPAEADNPAFKDNGTYLITGGLGDLALVFAQGLAERFRARLVLIGRTKLPPRETWGALGSVARPGRVANAIRSIQAIEKAGGQVLYVRADVTNVEDMKQVLAKAETAFGGLDGVLHTAGVVKDDLVEMKTIADLETVLAPKVYGTEVLNEVLAGRKLDIVVLFSSTSAATAPIGQIDYVAANAYLNAVAQSDAMQAHRQVLALQWGIWNEIGLAAREIAGPSAPEDATIEAVDRPLISRRLSEPGGAVRLELTCRPEGLWLLDQHRLKSGEAVWPGTGYIELLVEAARELGFTGALQFEQLSFLSPLHVPNGEDRTVVVLVSPDSAGRLSVTIHSEGADGAGQIHAEAVLLDASPPAVAAVDLAAIAQRCQASSESAPGETLRSAQEGHLRFGPRWSVLKAIRHGSGEKLAELEMHERFVDDLTAGFLAHPAVLDIATGFAMELIEGYDPAEALWVPAGYGQIRYFGPLPRQVVSWARIHPSQGLGADYATFDVVIAAADGTVLLQANEFTIKRVGKFLAMASSGAAAPAGEPASQAKRALPPQHKELSPAQQQLARLVGQGIRPAEGIDAFFRAVATGLPQIVVSSMDLPALMRLTQPQETPGADEAGFDRPERDFDYVAPAAGIETTLAGFWTKLLGVKAVGANDNFFDLGGHSLIAVRLFRMIKAEYAVDFPISVLFEAPTVAKCAALLRSAGAASSGDASDFAADKPAMPATRYVHLVPMSPGPGSGERPFFVCAGMFGNILNLRHLALHIGQDRPVYGLQAKGLFGNESPHETFEEMARDYLAELRSVQPTGPYLIGGFSGGGLVAYEMAQQLERERETVLPVILLDTPVPQRVTLSLFDRISIRCQDIRQQKGAFISTWLTKRIAWEIAQYRKRNQSKPVAIDQFHNAAIEAAFLRALWKYNVKPIQTACLLLRPKLKPHYTLLGGRELNDVRNLIWEDNGWTPYINALSIVEVPGDHDSMVLEPHVRALAKHIREALRERERPMVPHQRAAE